MPRRHVNGITYDDYIKYNQNTYLFDFIFNIEKINILSAILNWPADNSTSLLAICRIPDEHIAAVQWLLPLAMKARPYDFYFISAIRPKNVNNSNFWIMAEFLLLKADIRRLRSIID